MKLSWPVDKQHSTNLSHPLLTGHLLEKHPLSTGVVAALLGIETANGDFQVQDICFARKLETITEKEPVLDPHGKFIVLASGLNISTTSPFQISLLQDWISGDLSSPVPSENLVRLILAGNTVGSMEATKPKQVALERVDSVLCSLASSIPVDVMPSKNDPSTSGWPQQAMFPSLFSHSSQWSGLETRTNPWECEVADKLVIGTSGENLDDIFKYDYCIGLSRTRLAKSVLEWSHLAPTAPDTLCKCILNQKLKHVGCHPFNDKDPFVLTSLPWLFFVGNQPTYESAMVTNGTENTRIVLIPDFGKTGNVVLVNIETGTSHLVELSTEM